VSEPIVYISHFNIKEGKLEALRRHNHDAMQQIEADKPGTVAFLAYINEEGSEVSYLHVFPDASSMDHHVQGAVERAKASLEFIEATARELYGNPSDEVIRMLTPPEGSGITLHHEPRAFGGYLRLGSK
jgi:quinol monooxygenase YgiN